jgi:hypothetical protein
MLPAGPTQAMLPIRAVPGAATDPSTTHKCSNRDRPETVIKRRNAIFGCGQDFVVRKMGDSKDLWGRDWTFAGFSVALV